jgi:hypothetical protein
LAFAFGEDDFGFFDDPRFPLAFALGEDDFFDDEPRFPLAFALGEDDFFDLRTTLRASDEPV